MIDPNAIVVEWPNENEEPSDEQVEEDDSGAPERCIELKHHTFNRRGYKDNYYYRSQGCDFTQSETNQVVANDDPDFSVHKAISARRSQSLFGADGRFRFPEYASNQLRRGFKAVPDDGNISLGHQENKSAHVYWPTFVRDVFASVYGMSKSAIGQNEPAFAREYLDAIESSEEIKKITKASRLDPDFALKTAIEILSILPSPVPETEKSRNDREDGKAQKPMPRSPKNEAALDGIKRVMKVNSDQAQKIVDEKRDSDKEEEGPAQGNVGAENYTNFDDRFNHVNHSEIERISEIAGRAMSTAYNARSMNAAAPGGITDVECGRNVQRWLPAELALLSDPDTEMLALARFAESSALQFKMEGDDNMGRGDIVLFIDLSSSMHYADICFQGEDMDRNVWAAGVALALWQVANWQNRTCRLIGYTHAVCFDETVTSEKQATEILSRKYGGGTQLSAAIDYVVAKGYAKLADFVVISDGEDYGWEDSAKAAKAENSVRIHAVAISGEWQSTEELNSYTHVTGNQLDLTEQYSAL